MSPVVIGVHSGLYQHIRNSFENQSVVAGFAVGFFIIFFFFNLNLMTLCMTPT